VLLSQITITGNNSFGFLISKIFWGDGGHAPRSPKRKKGLQPLLTTPAGAHIMQPPASNLVEITEDRFLNYCEGTAL